MPSTNSKKQLRLRVFAGPNGSGKSTIIEHVKKSKVDGYPVDFGFYINADDIASGLRQSSFSFDSYEFQTSKKEFEEKSIQSGLINNDFTEEQFSESYRFRNNSIKLKIPEFSERLAQIIADFLRNKLLELSVRFSFETVFSHQSKLEIMQRAREAGYKVYLYFVSTESPEINKFRVQARVAQQGHNVPAEKIEQRYYRSMNLLYPACQLAYQAFFFDNSKDSSKEKLIDPGSLLFAHFKLSKGAKQWDDFEGKNVPAWFFDYYVDKVVKQ